MRGRTQGIFSMALIILARFYPFEVAKSWLLKMPDIERIPHTKQVSTIGPASESAEIIREISELGCRVFRLNLSHGTLDEKKRQHDNIREIESQLGVPIATIADIQGPKMRLGTMNTHYTVNEGDLVDLGDFSDGIMGNNHYRIPFAEYSLFTDLNPNITIGIDDGKIHLRFDSYIENGLRTIVKSGGKLTGRKGVTVPSNIKISHLTPTDMEHLKWASEIGVDFVALSFIQDADQVIQTRKLINSSIGIISKIEKSAAMENINEIISVSDGIMIARGDLALETFLPQLPALQKEITRLCLLEQKPVIVATHMMEHMIHHLNPSRAEILDVGNAVLDKVDAIMLSAETASGKYPVEAARVQTNVARAVEQSSAFSYIFDRYSNMDRNKCSGRENKNDPMMPFNNDMDGNANKSVINGIAKGIAELVHHTNIAILIVRSDDSGIYAALAAERIKPNIIALVNNVSLARRLQLTWGICPVFIDNIDEEEQCSLALRIALKNRFAQSGDRYVKLTTKSKGDFAVEISNIPPQQSYSGHLV